MGVKKQTTKRDERSEKQLHSLVLKERCEALIPLIASTLQMRFLNTLLRGVS